MLYVGFHILDTYSILKEMLNKDFYSEQIPFDPIFSILVLDQRKNLLTL